MIGNKIGSLGESITLKFLLQKGFILKHKNYWKPYGEIDIVVEKDRIFHFIEVKSVSYENPTYDSRETYNPAENVDKYKLQKLGRVIEAYIAEFHVKDWQFDVYTVEIDRALNKARIMVLPNQILPE